MDFILIFVIFFYSTHCLYTTPPVWVTSNLVRAGNNDIIHTRTGSNDTPTYTFTFSSSLPGTPYLGYGIKAYQGHDYLGQEFFEINRTSLNSSSFQVAVQILGNTFILLLNVPYIAIDPTFPHHLNSFDNVPVNYSAGPLINITLNTTTRNYYTNIINYTQQAAGMTYKTFQEPLSRNKVLLFLTSLFIRGTNEGISVINNPINFTVNSQVYSTSQYKIQVSVSSQSFITKLHFSMVVFDQTDVMSQKNYMLYYQQIDLPYTGGFIPVPVEFINNFIMGMLYFSSNKSQSVIDFQWDFQYVNGVHGVYMPLSIGQSYAIYGNQTINSVTFTLLYLKTWVCPNLTFFDPNQNLCTSCPLLNCLVCLNLTACSLCDLANNYYLNTTTLQCQYIIIINNTTNTTNSTSNTTDNTTIMNGTNNINWTNFTNSTDINFTNSTNITDNSTNTTNTINITDNTTNNTINSGNSTNMTDINNSTNRTDQNSTNSTNSTDNSTNITDNSTNTTDKNSAANITNSTDTNTTNSTNITNTTNISNTTDTNITNTTDNSTFTNFTNSTTNISDNTTNSTYGTNNTINTTDNATNTTNQSNFNSTNNTTNSTINNTNNSTNITNNITTSLCGNGILQAGQLCDDGNTISFDGCSSLCELQDLYQCANKISLCSSTFVIIEDSFKMSKTSCNKFQLIFRTNSINFISRIQEAYFANAGLTIVERLVKDDTVTVLVDYSRDIYNETLELLIPSSSFRLGVSSDSGIPLLKYEEDQCQTYEYLKQITLAIQIMSYIVLLISLLSCKIVGLELFGVLQLAYFSLAEHDFLNLYLSPLISFKIFNGLNLPFFSEPSYLLPSNIQTLGISASFINNCNIMLILLFLQLLVSFFLFLISKVTDSDRLLNIRNVSQRLFKEGFITLVMFNIFNLTFSAGIHWKYYDILDSSTFWSSFALYITLFAIILSILCLELLNEVNYGEFKLKFKENFVCRSYILISILYRMTLGFCMALKNDYDEASLILLGISMTFVLYNLINLPFSDYVQNYRCNLIHITQLIIILCANYYRSMNLNTPIPIKGRLFQFSIFQIVMIILCLILSMIIGMSQLIKTIKTSMKKKSIIDIQNNFETMVAIEDQTN